MESAIQQKLEKLDTAIKGLNAVAENFQNFRKELNAHDSRITNLDGSLDQILDDIHAFGRKLSDFEQWKVELPDSASFKTKLETQSKNIAQLKKDLKDAEARLQQISEDKQTAEANIQLLHEQEQEGIRESKTILNSLLQRIRDVHQVTEFMSTQVNAITTEQQKLKAKLDSVDTRLVDPSEIRHLKRWLVILSVLWAFVLLIEGYRFLRILVKFL